nr:MAG TPA: hypothetical protein [Caudoviricetes sp.]
MVLYLVYLKKLHTCKRATFSNVALLLLSEALPFTPSICKQNVR